MLDFINHMTIKLLKNRFLFKLKKKTKVLPNIRDVLIGVISLRYQNL